MSPTVSDDDEAKRVVDGAGNSIGLVTEVRDGTAYVDPNPDIDDQLKSQLGWGRLSQDTYPLRHDAIDEITDDEIRLQDDYVP